MLKEMIAGLEHRLFEGDQLGKCPKYSMLDLDQANFRYALLAYSGVLKQVLVTHYNGNDFYVQ